ncbi:BTB/POZ and MATH domain-containing protein 1 [Zea mays]|uniref:BTB/POZ and MATH domain-containing protein 1 n=1 Tax=Zea mays TaxID=4577 RepID=A0A317Y0C3_MAIZE|nr:BTB/POZ and MATH domain-containing protein 1 [Zea mays]
MSDSTFNFCFTHQFNLNYEDTEKVAIGYSVSSENILAGGHLWRIVCYPREDRLGKENKKGECLSMFLIHESESKDAKAIFEAFVMDKEGTVSSSSHQSRLVHVFAPKGSRGSDGLGWASFVERSVLKSRYVTNDGSFVIVGAVKVVQEEDPLDLPPSNIGSHLGLLLDSTASSDVTFVVDGERFAAHRAVLAARSPVFNAQLFGSMADATMTSIPLHGISAATFRAMLRFMYTDACPEEADDYSDLLAAADRFDLDRLKLLCARKLWNNVSEDTVAVTLICAETYNCPQLKSKCVGFFGEGKDFKTRAVLTDDFARLALQFPSILDELWEMAGA